LINQKEITKEIRKYFKFNESKNKIFPNSWDAATEFLRKRFIALNSYVTRGERPKIKI
jgi:hypothetical protein